MSFEWPLMLLALLVVPLALAGYYFLQRRPARYAVAYTNLDVLASVVDRPSVWRRYVPPALFLLALAALAMALARPEVPVTVDRENATVILVIDSSGSMLAKDVNPTRLDAAKQAVETFLDRIPEKFRVGLITFAEEADVVAPVTSDHEVVRDALGFLFPQRGTALGDAIARAAELARDATGRTPVTPPRRSARSGEKPPVAILFLSDGFQTAGTLAPQEGAQLAKSLGIPVFTIALGTPDGVIDRSWGGIRRVIPVPPDPETLQGVAEQTGGKFYDAPSSEALQSAYAELGSLLGTEPGELEATFAFLGAGAALALAAAALSVFWSSRLP